MLINVIGFQQYALKIKALAANSLKLSPFLIRGKTGKEWYFYFYMVELEVSSPKGFVFITS